MFRSGSIDQQLFEAPLGNVMNVIFIPVIGGISIFADISEDNGEVQ